MNLEKNKCNSSIKWKKSYFLVGNRVVSIRSLQLQAYSYFFQANRGSRRSEAEGGGSGRGEKAGQEGEVGK